MKYNRRPIKYKKERVVLSDVLPFEIPLTFSNRQFYDFLISNEIEMDENKIRWKPGDEALNEIIKLMFDLRDKPLADNEVVIGRANDLTTIPFSFKISHKENDFRELTIIHPKNQLELIEYYNKFNQLILHYSNISRFSIRQAKKTARFTYHKDLTHKEKLAEDQQHDTVEEYDKEYESLKTFFVYKNYSNVYKFFESYKFHHCEKKYNKLLRFDILKCFDSIYTHSISWAILNKEIVKEELGTDRSSRFTFSGKFDDIMQHLNYGETNGIVIGPEFSRIYAELILQRIDKEVESYLKKTKNITFKVDYEIYRYVDDFFLFFNDEITKDEVVKTYQLRLKEYKLYINDSKKMAYEKPLITEITIAKQKITELLNKYLAYKIENEKLLPNDPNEADILVGEAKVKDSNIYVSSNKLITKFKTIISQTKIDYKDIMNYSLAVIERKIAKLLKDYAKLEKKDNSEKVFVKALLEILDFTFFIYSVSPRVNTTIKLCRVLRNVTEFLSKKKMINIDFKHLIFKKIYDNVYFTLHKNKSLEHTQIETLYLLIALGELGKEYWLDFDLLCSYMNISKDQQGRLTINGSLNYFTIVVLLFYVKKKKRYDSLRDFLQEHIIQKFSSVAESNLSKHAELVFLLFDVLSCPYIGIEFKKRVLTLFGIANDNTQESIIARRKFWFTKWTDFDFGKELDAKHGQEVY